MNKDISICGVFSSSSKCEKGNQPLVLGISKRRTQMAQRTNARRFLAYAVLFTRIKQPEINHLSFVDALH